MVRFCIFSEKLSCPIDRVFNFAAKFDYSPNTGDLRLKSRRKKRLKYHGSVEVEWRNEALFTDAVLYTGARESLGMSMSSCADFQWPLTCPKATEITTLEERTTASRQPRLENKLRRIVSSNVAQQLNNLFNPIVKVNGIGHPFGGVCPLLPSHERKKKPPLVSSVLERMPTTSLGTKAFPRPLGKRSARASSAASRKCES
ncbi:hypothetical protein K0M31_017164 [Melipona bicolor]|uniref:Uncharacterized protein n=1 Tax=Melipona bicolor TaxID=60889 RepID=A0AA40KS69_9HYME|nr:hypothetical protein K0M31_017164 [Melipona bicolor]